MPPPVPVSFFLASRVELLDITAREQSTLQKAFGYHDPTDIADAIKAMFDVENEQITKVRRDPDLYLAFTWLALRHNDYLKARKADEMAAELADLDIQIAWAQLDFDVEATEGKDESSTPTGTSTT